MKRSPRAVRPQRLLRLALVSFLMVAAAGWAVPPVEAQTRSRDCVNADGRRYREGSRLGPFVCRDGRWINEGQ